MCIGCHYIFKNKIAELGNLIDSADPDIITGTETWLNSQILNAEIFPPGYSITRKDRADGYGGVLLAIKSTIPHEPIPTPNDLDCAAAKITIDKNKTAIIVVIYRPPNSGLIHIDSICHAIEDISAKFKNSVLWIAGDLNLPDISWEDSAIKGNQYSLNINQRFLDMTQSCHLEQTVKTPTRRNNILDLFLTNRPSLISRCITIPGISDHDAVYVETTTSAPRLKPQRRKIHLWKRAYIPNLKQDAIIFTSEFINIYNSNSYVHTMWGTIKTQLTNLLDTHVPNKLTSTRHNQPWITTEIKRLTRQKKKAYNRSRGKPKTSKQNQRFQTLEKKTKWACKVAYREYITNMISPVNGNVNPKRLYNFIKSKRNDNMGITCLEGPDGVIRSDSSTKANILNQQFQSVFTLIEDKTNIPNKGTSPHPGMNPITVTPAGVKKLLNNLKEHKATGPDQLPTNLLKS